MTEALRNGSMMTAEFKGGGKQGSPEKADTPARRPNQNGKHTGKRQ